MLKLADKLTQDKVDEILSRLLPSEKSARRRMNKLESFVFTKSQEGRAWLENYLLANGKNVSEEELDKFEKTAFTITLSVLYEFEAYLKDESYWHLNKRQKTPENVEARIMESQPCRWLARFQQNRGKKVSKNVGGIIYDTILQKIKSEGNDCSSKRIFEETKKVVDWHPELEDNDRVSECRWNEEVEDWDLVVVKPDGRIVGQPTKTIEDIVKEGIIARTRTVGVSGKKLNADDAFLGILAHG